MPRRRKPDLPLLERIPPHSLEAEQAVLGACLLEREAIATATSAVEANDFYSPQHQMIFEAVKALYADALKARHPEDRLCDLVTLQSLLSDSGLLEQVGGEPYLLTLQGAAPTAAGIAHYCAIVREKAILRGLIHAAGEIQQMAASPGDENLAQILEQCEAQIVPLIERHVMADGSPLMTEDQLIALGAHQEFLVAPMIPTKATTVMAGPGGVGKSYLALSLCVAVTCRTQKWLGRYPIEGHGSAIYIDKENGEGILSDRLLALRAALPPNYERAGMVHFLGDNFPFSLGMGVRRLIPHLKGRNIRLVVIDCLAAVLPGGPGQNRESDNAFMREAIMPLTFLARQWGFAAVPLHHFNKPNPQMPNASMLDRIRGASAIKDTADSVLGVVEVPGEEMLRQVHHLKTRAKTRATGFEYEYRPEEGTAAVHFLWTGEARTTELMHRAAMKERILEHLRDTGQATTAELDALALGIGSRHTAARGRKELEREGVIVSEGGGQNPKVWRLV